MAKTARTSQKRQNNAENYADINKNGKLNFKNGNENGKNGRVKIKEYFEMRNSNNRGTKCTKTLMSKCADANGVAKTYSDIQFRYCQMLEEDDTVDSYKLNVPLTDFPITDHQYTTDFLISLNTEELVVGECVQRDLITRPKTVALLDASRDYWLKRGVKPENWKIITNKE